MGKDNLTYDEHIALKNSHFANKIKRYVNELKRLSNPELLFEYVCSANRNRSGTTSEVLGFRSLQRKHCEQEVLNRMRKKKKVR